MVRDNDGGAGGVLMAFVLGAVSGAAVALLLAPNVDEETRRRLEETRRRVNETAREGRERATDVARQGREFVNRQRENITSAVDRGREAYQRAQATSEDTTEAPA